MKKKSEYKFCIDCKWYRNDYPGSALQDCTHPKTVRTFPEKIDLITGVVTPPLTIYTRCATQRSKSNNAKCGSEGRLFERKEIAIEVKETGWPKPSFREKFMTFMTFFVGVLLFVSFAWFSMLLVTAILDK